MQKYQNKPKYEYAIVVLSMTAMMVTIVALTSMLFIDAQKNTTPMVFQKTEIVKSDKAFPRIPKFLTTGTYRVRCRTQVTTFGVVQGSQDWSGSSFGVNLSEYGLSQPRYLVSAAHVVLQQSGKPADIIEIQIRTDTEKEWVRCKIIVADKDRDLAVLECIKDLPVIFKVADNVDIGAPVIVSGCPQGTTPSAVMGFLTSKDPDIMGQQIMGRSAVKCTIWQASAPFYLGNSGGPVLDAETHQIVAVLVAGIRTADGGMIPNLAICIPCIELKKLLNETFVLREPKAEIVPSLPPFPQPQVKPPVVQEPPVIVPPIKK